MSKNNGVITLSVAENDKSSSLYIKNNSGTVGGTLGNITMELFMANGRAEVVKIPASALIIDASVYTNKTTLLNAPQFRKLVQQGMIQLYSEEAFNEQMKNKLKKREYDRLFEVKKDSTAEIHKEREKFKAENAAKKEELDTVDTDKDEAALETLIDMDDDAAVSIYLRSVENLTTDQLRRVATNAKHPDVREAAAQEVVDRQVKQDGNAKAGTPNGGKGVTIDLNNQ